MPPFQQLHEELRSPDPRQILEASWDALDLAIGLADAVAWRDGFDELHALAAGQTCDQARSLLPLPRQGRPLDTPAASAENARRCAELLDALHTALRTLPSGAGDPVRTAADLVHQAARSFRALPTA